MIVEVIDALKSFDAVFKNYGQLEVANGAWMAHGDILSILPADRPVRNPGTSGIPFHEEVYVISAKGAGSVTRHVRHVGYERWDAYRELVVRLKGLWVSSDPFAILVVENNSLPDPKRDARCRTTVSHRLYWARQIEKDGEIEGYIPTPRLNVVSGKGSGGEAHEWVSLMELAKAADMEPYTIVSGFLLLKIFGSDASQPSYVFAENDEALKAGLFTVFPDIKMPKGMTRTSFLAATHKDEDDVSPESVWVARVSAEKMLRMAALGVKSASLLFPPRFV